jgi:hypothetical protein
LLGAPLLGVGHLHSLLLEHGLELCQVLLRWAQPLGQRINRLSRFLAARVDRL